MDEKALRCDTSLEAELCGIGCMGRKGWYLVEFSDSQKPMYSVGACSSGRSLCMAERRSC